MPINTKHETGVCDFSELTKWKLNMTFNNYTLRLFSNDDLDANYFLMVQNRERIEDFFTEIVSKAKTFVDTGLFLLDILERTNDIPYIPDKITVNSNQRTAGFTDLKNMDWNIPKSEMDLSIDRYYANQRISTKSFKLFCVFCFAKFKFHLLFLKMHHIQLCKTGGLGTQI
jgi:ribosomal-protein-serine acetyltransferase